MADLGVSRVSEVGAAEGAVNGCFDVRKIGDVVLGFVEHQIAGAAWRYQILRAGFLGDGQIARGEHAGLGLVHRHVGRGAATVPIVQFGQFHAQVPHDGQERFLISAAEALERATGEIESISCRLLGFALALAGAGQHRGQFGAAFDVFVPQYKPPGANHPNPSRQELSSGRQSVLRNSRMTSCVSVMRPLVRTIS